MINFIDTQVVLVLDLICLLNCLFCFVSFFRLFVSWALFFINSLRQFLYTIYFWRVREVKVAKHKNGYPTDLNIKQNARKQVHKFVAKHPRERPSQLPMIDGWLEENYKTCHQSIKTMPFFIYNLIDKKLYLTTTYLDLIITLVVVRRKKM